MAFIPFLRAPVARRLPTPTNFRVRQALELDRFSEFVTDISPAQQQAINALALEIVRSNDTNDPIFEFRVEGHADIARTIPAPQRKDFENDISEERAENGFRLLVQALEKNGGAAFAAKIAKNSKAFGMGTQRLKIPNATTVMQFEQNRRVVFFVREVTFIPAPPEPPPAPTSVIEEQFSVRLASSANISIGFAKVLESFSLTPQLEIVDLIDKKRAMFRAFSTGVGVSFGPTKAGGQVTFSAGPAVKFKIFRLLGRNRADISLKRFEGDDAPTLNKNEFSTRTYDNGTVIVQQIKRNRRTDYATLNAGVDHAFDERSTVSVSGLFNREKILDNGKNPYFDGSLQNRYRLWQFLKDEVKYTAFGTANFVHKFPQPGHTLTLTGNYSFHREDEKYFFTNTLPSFVGSDAFKLLSDEHVVDFNADYIKPLRRERVRHLCV